MRQMSALYGAEMNRIQVLLALGLFLIVALFGWRTYLEKSSHKNRNDARGLPTEFLKDVKVFKSGAVVPTQNMKANPVEKSTATGVNEPAATPTP